MTNGQAGFDLESLLEFVECNLCGSSEFKVKQPPRYEATQTIESFAKHYSSSSETKLMDQLVVCKYCGLEYLNPRIKSSFTFLGYSEAVDKRHHEEDMYRIHSFKRALRKVQKDLVCSRKNGERVRILDVGCAGGAFLKAASDMGYEAIGLEPSRYLAELGQKNYNVEIHQDSLDSFVFSKNEFDIVTFWDVLEHVPNPREALQNAHEALSESGTLLLNLPMIDTWPAKFMKLRWPFYLNVHTYYFSKKTIESLLLSSGFQIVSTKTYWQSLSLGYVLTRAGITVPHRIREALNVSVKYYLGQRTIVARKL